jgi:hypothetical protein
MTPRPPLLACLLVAACAPPAPAPDREAQQRACAAIVGPHVGMQPDAVPVAWDHATPEGTAIVRIGPPGRVHTCEVNADLRVLEVLHPE